MRKPFSDEKGFFQFGSGLTCFGRCYGGNPAPQFRTPLYDASANLESDGTTITLPFDPSEVVNNLRLERYITLKHGAIAHAMISFLKAGYYCARPILPSAIRRRVQRSWAAGWKEIPFPTWPVDCTVDILMKKVLGVSMKAQNLDSVPFIWFWPEGYSSAAMMTHDVETESGRDFCADLMTLDDGFGIKSSFNLVPEQRYAITSDFVREIGERRFEVGIHDLNHDGRLFSNRDTFDSRVGKINEYAKRFGATGFRSAVLYRNPDWYDALGVVYDSSVPNVAPVDPQIGGCCTVMPYFINGLVELPLTTVQDYTLLHVLQKYSTDLWISQMEIILAQHGLISFLVHPDYAIDGRARDLYCALLADVMKRLRNANAWFALPREIAIWWKQRSQMELRDHNGEWIVVGEGSARARVAYAVLDNDHLSYDLRPAEVLPSTV